MQTNMLYLGMALPEFGNVVLRRLRRKRKNFCGAGALEFSGPICPSSDDDAGGNLG